jgi:hypothetical protein
MPTSPTTDNTNPSEKDLYTMLKKTNMNAPKKEANKPFSATKAYEPTAKATKRKPTAAAKQYVANVHSERNAVERKQNLRS